MVEFPEADLFGCPDGSFHVRKGCRKNETGILLFH